MLFCIVQGVFSGINLPALPKNPTLVLHSQSPNSMVTKTPTTKFGVVSKLLTKLTVPNFLFPTVLEMTGGGPLSVIVYILLTVVNEQFGRKFVVDFLKGFTFTWVLSKIGKSLTIFVIKHGFFQFWRKGNKSDEKLNRITNEILKKSKIQDENVSVHVVKNKELKGLAGTTTGFDSTVIVVHEGYLKKEAELRAVLAHEVGHIKARDAKNVVADEAKAGGYNYASWRAYRLFLGFQNEEGHIKWAMEKLKDKTSLPVPSRRGLLWDVMKPVATIPDLPAMLMQNYRNQIQSGFYMAFLTLPYMLSTASKYAKRRKAELVADAHAVKICGPIPLISVLRPELIAVFTTAAQVFYFAFVAIVAQINVSASLLIFCVGWSGWIDFSWPLQLMNGSQLRRCFHATGLLKKKDKPNNWLDKALNWLLNESTHPGIDERIEAILSRME